MKKVVVIGGGIIGLSSAFYLQRAGHQVTLIDKDGFTDNCSYGNLGYVCPSHFIPLTSPGIVLKGLRWMANSHSPFYIAGVKSWCLTRRTILMRTDSR